LAYLDSWEASVRGRDGPFSAEERSNMLLSEETRLGLRMTSRFPIPFCFLSDSDYFLSSTLFPGAGTIPFLFARSKGIF